MLIVIGPYYFDLMYIFSNPVLFFADLQLFEFTFAALYPTTTDTTSHGAVEVHNLNNHAVQR